MCQEKIENVKNDAICHFARQNQYNPTGRRDTINRFKNEPTYKNKRMSTKSSRISGLIISSLKGFWQVGTKVNFVRLDLTDLGH